MIRYLDNFLSEEDFRRVNSAMKSRFKIIRNKDTTWKYRPTATIGSREVSKTREELMINLGSCIPDIIDKIRIGLVEQFGIVNPQLNSAWYLYMDPDKTVGWHIDGPLGGVDTDLDKCYTFGLYAHDRWHDDWGGEWQCDTESYLPKPNRLVGWTRKEPHWVSPITHTNYDHLRMCMCTSWIANR